MGEAGLATRVLALKYDACLLTYCALPSGAGTAPGQVTVTDMLEVYRARAIRGDTAIYGLIGPRTDRARTREHNAWLRARALDAVAVPLLVPPDGDPARTIAAFRALGARGFHVDPPHQQEAARAVDDLDSSAIRAGKVDTVYWRAGALVGAWAGSPVEQLALWRG